MATKKQKGNQKTFLETYLELLDAVQVVHARWITDENGVTYCGHCRCIDDYASVHNYCPICGARMDGDSE